MRHGFFGCVGAAGRVGAVGVAGVLGVSVIPRIAFDAFVRRPLISDRGMLIWV
jgi:hypothetical protein